jgi:hypothetical protein
MLGIALSLFLLRIGRLATKFKVYQALSWFNFAALLGDGGLGCLRTALG